MSGKIELNLKQKIIEIINKLKLTKEGKNTFNKYTYFLPSQIMAHLNPLLKEFGVLTHFDMVLGEDKTYYICTLKLIDASTDQEIVYTLHLRESELKGCSAAQQVGSTYTYGKRYLLQNVFNIAEDDLDLDSNTMSKRVKDAEKSEKCKECGNQIVGNKKATVDDVISYSTKNFGKAMCISCQYKVKKKMEESVNE